MLGAIVALNAAFTMASEGERADFASVSAPLRHQITFAGIPGCDINLERVAGSVGVGLYERWKATAVGSCPADPVYEFSLRGVGETAFAMKRDFATKGSVVDSLMRTNWIWTPMVRRK